MATLTIDFTVPIPAPVNGFIVKYRPVGTTTYTTVFPNPTASPIIVTVPAGTAYEGTIKSDCGNSSTSPEFTFTAFASTEIFAPIGTDISSACAGSVPPASYISNAYSDINTGVSVYTDPALTILLTGPSYIVNAFGMIYNISGGVVGASTGQVCGATSNTYSIPIGGGASGSDPVGFVCSLFIWGTRYIINGQAFAVGTRLYVDPAATTPMTDNFYYKTDNNKWFKLNNGYIEMIGNC